MWLGLLVALVVVALVVSFTADDQGDALDEEPFDRATFCLTAARFGSVSELDFTTTGLDQLRGLRTVALQLATLSPKPVAEDLDAVGQAIQRVVDTVQAIPPEDPAGAALVAESLDRELATVTQQAEDAATYIERWCGPRPTETTAVPGGEPAAPDTPPGELAPGPGDGEPSG
jgi:hypothetical protein